MKKIRWIAAVFLILALLLPSGCGEKKLTAEEAIDAFLSGSSKLYISEDIADFVMGEEFTVRQLCDKVSESVDEFIMGVEAYDLMYALLDCGADGKTDLAIRQCLHGEEDLYFNVYFLIQYDGSRLSPKAFYTDGNVDEGVYSSIDITEEGLVDFSYLSFDNDGNISYYSTDHYYVNGGGKELFIYSDEFCDLERAIIPVEYLPIEVYGDLENYPDSGYGDILCTVINFEEFLPGDDDSDAYYEEYIKHNVYVFTDGEDDVEIDPEYKEFYDDLGLKYCSFDEAMEMIDERCKEIKLSGEIRNGAFIEWLSIEDKYKF